MSTENVDKITAAQCRGARGLLAITQPELASAAKLGLSTIVDFEKLEKAGVGRKQFWPSALHWSGPELNSFRKMGAGRACGYANASVESSHCRKQLVSERRITDFAELRAGLPGQKAKLWQACSV